MSSLMGEIAFEDKCDYEKENKERDDILNGKLSDLKGSKASNFTVYELDFLLKLNNIGYYNIWSSHDIKYLESMYSSWCYG